MQNTQNVLPMRYTEHTLTVCGFDPERRQGRDALFTVGNGYFGVRGFFEEDAAVPVGNGGIYAADVFGRGDADAWEGKTRTLCNLINILRLRLTADGETVRIFIYVKLQWISWQNISLRMRTACASQSWMR